MVKRKNLAKNVEDDDIYDEIDRHHMELDGDISDEDVRPKRRRQREVLSVDVDENELGEDDDGASDMSSFASGDEEEDLGKTLPGGNKWGKKRKAFYGTSYVDEDWGGVNESEEELLELEEEDAIARQKKLDSAIAAVDYDALAETADLVDEEEEKRVEKTEGKEISPELDEMVEDYKEKKATMKALVEPLGAMLKGPLGKCDCVLRRQIALVYGAYSHYLTNLLLYFQLKITTSLDKLKNVSNHPIVDDLIKFKKILDKVDTFVDSNRNRLEKLIRKVDASPTYLERYVAAQTQERSAKKKSKKTAKKLARYRDEKAPMDLDEVDVDEGDDDWLEDEEDDDEEDWLGSSGGGAKTKKNRKKKAVAGPPELAGDDERRKINYEIEKNKGLLAKRKKGTQHARVKKRRQYDKALIRRRSQVPDVKRETTKYSGEKRGITAATIRSVKLKA
ncbi:something about silencing protein 10-like protein [Aphelenchoides avenae]|nr:something about silencing protein 10-like protein [Aphelenchus avenae]